MCITDNNYSFVGCLLSIAPSKIKMLYFNNWFIGIIILILLRGVANVDAACIIHWFFRVRYPAQTFTFIHAAALLSIFVF